MGVVALKIKIMPESPGVDLEKLKKEVEEKLKEIGAIRIESSEEQPIAFGLKALIITLAWPEDSDTGAVENIEIPGTSSIQIIDYRRAIG